MSTQFAESTTSYKSSEFQWNHSATWLLINSYLELVDEFRDPRNREKDLWIQISDKFRELGSEIPPELLDKKFRNLKSTYQMIKKRNNPKKQIKWEYYRFFEELIKAEEIASSRPANDSRRSSAYIPFDAKRKLTLPPSSESITEGIQLVTIEPADEDHDSVTVDDNSSETRRNERVYELNINLEDSRDGVFDDEDNQFGTYNHNGGGGGKKFNLNNLQARKLQAETRYFNRKADYFQKQTACLDVQRKLMIMQAHKLKLEIEQLKAMQDD